MQVLDTLRNDFTIWGECYWMVTNDPYEYRIQRIPPWKVRDLFEEFDYA